MEHTSRMRVILHRGTAVGLALLLAVPFAGTGTALAQQSAATPPPAAAAAPQAPAPAPAPPHPPPQTGTTPQDASQPQQQPAVPAPPPDAGQPSQEPARPELKPPSSRPSEPAQPNPEAPVGTAVAPYEKGVGVGASRPAGAVIAPAKQRRTRSFLLKSALIIGAAGAVGTVVGLSNASPSRPSTAH